MTHKEIMARPAQIDALDADGDYESAHGEEDGLLYDLVNDMACCNEVEWKSWKAVKKHLKKQRTRWTA